VNHVQRIDQDDERVTAVASDILKRNGKQIRTPCLMELKPNAECRGGRFCLGYLKRLKCRISGIPDDGEPGGAGNDLLDQFELLLNGISCY